MNKNIADEEDTFLLMDGTRLEGVPRERSQELKWPSAKVQGAACELFARNAHFLLAHANRILSDSRLFLAPVWIQSGMAYAGPLKMPCLGGYIEWWLHSPCAVMGEGEEKALTYFISGSPLSGTNVSACVRADGERVRSKSNLLTLANSFNRTMERYTLARCRFQSYTLEEALSVLKGRVLFEDSMERMELEQTIRRQERENQELNRRLEQGGERIRECEAALVRKLVQERAQDLRAAYAMANGNESANAVTKIFRAFSKANGVHLSPAPRRTVEALLP